MLDRGVVDDEIHQHPDATLARRADQYDHVAERPHRPVDGVVVADVVAVVTLGAGEDRLQPHEPDAETLQVVEPAADAHEVAVAVTVAVEPPLDVEAVAGRGEPPLVAGVRDAHTGAVPPVPGNGSRA